MGKYTDIPVQRCPYATSTGFLLPHWRKYRCSMPSLNTATAGQSAWEKPHPDEPRKHITMPQVQGEDRALSKGEQEWNSINWSYNANVIRQQTCGEQWLSLTTCYITMCWITIGYDYQKPEWPAKKWSTEFKAEPSHICSQNEDNNIHHYGNNTLVQYG